MVADLWSLTNFSAKQREELCRAWPGPNNVSANRDVLEDQFVFILSFVDSPLLVRLTATEQELELSKSGTAFEFIRDSAPAVCVAVDDGSPPDEAAFEEAERVFSEVGK